MQTAVAGNRRNVPAAHPREDDAIRADVERAVAAVVPARQVSVDVRDGVVLLLGRVEWRSTRAAVDERVRAVPGVVAVADRLGFVFDDGARRWRRRAR